MSGDPDTAGEGDTTLEPQTTGEPEAVSDERLADGPVAGVPSGAPQPATPERSASGAIEGADSAALGTAATPATAPPGASVDPSESVVPGARFDRPLTEAKPWFTSLAAESDQAGVANEDPGEAETD